MVGSEMGKCGIEGREHGTASSLMIIMDNTDLRSSVPRIPLINLKWHFETP